MEKCWNSILNSLKTVVNRRADAFEKTGEAKKKKRRRQKKILSGMRITSQYIFYFSLNLFRKHVQDNAVSL